MKTAEFFIAAAGFVNAMCTDSASFCVICGALTFTTFKSLMKQWEEEQGRTSRKTNQNRNFQMWKTCKLPRKEKKVEAA